MQESIFLNTAHYHVMPARRERITPRDRYIVYHEDLYRSTGEAIERQSLFSGDQYTHVELADTLFERVGEEILPHLDVLVTSDWVPEFDPEFSAFVPYLHHKWSLTCQSFDVTDQGSIAPILGLRVLQEYLLADAYCTTGLVLGVEQSTVPQGKEAHFPAPHKSSVGAVRISKSKTGAAAEILATAFFSEAQIVDEAFNVHDLMKNWATTFALDAGSCTLAIRRNTYLYRKWCYRKELAGDATYHVSFLPAQYSCMNLFEWLCRYLSDDAEYGKACLFIDEDVESLAAAAVLVRRL